MNLIFTHVELGIATVVDFDYGALKAKAQLSPNSNILRPDRHLTGCFGFYYRFDSPHADESNVGNFVLMLGGDHQAFKIPDGSGGEKHDLDPEWFRGRKTGRTSMSAPKYIGWCGPRPHAKTRTEVVNPRR